MSGKGYPCACCGHLTRGEPDFGTFEICSVCDWEDDNAQAADPSLRGGANRVSLNEARANFRAFGASCREALPQGRGPLEARSGRVRESLPEEIPDP